ncbi:MAG: hypothetical protein ACJAXN_000380 [Psychromonas sp.]
MLKAVAPKDKLSTLPELGLKAGCQKAKCAYDQNSDQRLEGGIPKSKVSMYSWNYAFRLGWPQLFFFSVYEASVVNF